MENLLERNGIRTFGITEIEEKGLRLCWSASGIEFTTAAKEIVIEMEGESKGREEDAFFAVFVKGERMQYKVQVFPGKKECVLYPESSEEEVSIRILKLTEEQYGKVWISGIRLDGRIWISPASFSDPVEENGEQEESNVLSGDAKQKPHLLFIGDSITAGYGVDGVNGESAFCTEEEDVSKAYAYKTAEKLGAEKTIVCFSGNGVLSRWIPAEELQPLTEQILPEIFPYEEVKRSIALTKQNGECAPDYIVINLGTNDASYTRRISEREEAFVEKYRAFVQRLQEVFPDSPILLLYGVMEQTLMERVKEVAEQCKVEFLPLPLQAPEDGMGAAEHPSERTQEKMAERLLSFLKKKNLH